MKEQPIEVDGERYVGTTVSMGNPHLVIFVNDIEAIDLTVIVPNWRITLSSPDASM